MTWSERPTTTEVTGDETRDRGQERRVKNSMARGERANDEDVKPGCVDTLWKSMTERGEKEGSVP